MRPPAVRDVLEPVAEQKPGTARVANARAESHLLVQVPWNPPRSRCAPVHEHQSGRRIGKKTVLLSFPRNSSGGRQA